MQLLAFVLSVTTAASTVYADFLLKCFFSENDALLLHPNIMSWSQWGVTSTWPAFSSGRRPNGPFWHLNILSSRRALPDQMSNLRLDKKIWVAGYCWKLSVKGIQQKVKKKKQNTGPLRCYVGRMLQLARVQTSKWACTCSSVGHNNVAVICRRVTESRSAAALLRCCGRAAVRAALCGRWLFAGRQQAACAPSPAPELCFTRRQMLPGPFLFTSRCPTKSFAPLHGDGRQIFEVCSHSFLNKALIIQ